MGTLYQAQCPKCDYTAEFPLGAGLLSMDPLRQLSLFSQEDQIQIRRLEKDGELYTVSSENMLISCSHCGRETSIGVKTILSAEDRKNQLYTIGSCCNLCQRPLEIISEKQLKEGCKISCPKCGEEPLSFRKIGLWD